MNSRFEAAVRSVVQNDNCSGCGACAALSSRVEMKYDSKGYLRPVVTGAKRLDETRLVKSFDAICPGRSVRMPKIGSRKLHPIFGPYIESFQGFASDSSTRFNGSSGGVLTALAAYALKSGEADTAVMAQGSSANPQETVAVNLTDPRAVLKSSGSRYAPVAVASEASTGGSNSVFVGKPCEVSAAYEIASRSGSRNSSPLLLSFFCAGTPSQFGTSRLSEMLSDGGSEIVDVRYRGMGWPGSFRVTQRDGKQGTMSYDDSWGKHLGRDIQWRCKVCIDGTAAHADISVGDFWYADAKGYPSFDDAAGNSVVIARTARGQRFLAAAASEGVVTLQDVRLDDVAAIQPLQVERRVTIAGRLAGRLVAGKRVPRYRGYEMLSTSRAATVMQLLRAFVGTARRSRRLSRDS